MKPSKWLMIWTMFCMLLSPFPFFASPAAAAQPAAAPSLLITEIMAAPKAAGEPYEFVELYNTTSQPIDLTGYQIHYYTQPGLAQPWTDANAKKWTITKNDSLAEQPTNMVIDPHATKVVWLVKPGNTYKVSQFIAEYGDSTLTADQFVFVMLGASEGLDNAVQRNVAIVAPGGDPAADRISMAAYNVNAGTASCAYSPTPPTPACDFKKTASVQQTVIYFFPAGGLGPDTRLMERRTSGSLNQTPSPGKLSAGQEPLLPAEVLNPTAAISGGTATVNWTEPADLGGKADYTHVDIYVNGVKAAGPIAKGTTSATIPGLTANTGYTFKLVTVSGVGIEGAGVSVIATSTPSASVTGPSLLITEIMAAPKAAGEPYEFVELYNTTSQPIDLTGYQIHYYTQPGLAQPWTDANAKKWTITKNDSLAEQPTNMVIDPHATKVVWLVKPGNTYKVSQFIAEYGDSTLTADQFVFVMLGASEGLDNAVQRNVAIVAPGGDPAADRISMAAYNVNAGTAGCAYSPTPPTPACDFKKTTSVQQTVIYFFPAGGLDPDTRLMERRTSGSLNQTPSPGKLSAGQEPLLPAEVLNPTAAISGGTATVNWTEPADLGGKADYTHVDIYVNGVKAAGPIAKGTTSATIPGLTANTGYTFKLVTVSAVGIESLGAVKSIGAPQGSGITQEGLGLRPTKLKVAAIGDSITRNTGTTTTYPQNLGILLGSDFEVRNYGVSGTTLLKKGDSPYWNTPEYQQSKDWNPDIVVIMLGSNDSKPQNWQYKGEFAADYADLIQQYKSLPSNPRVFVNLPPKVYGSGNYGITDEVVKNEVIPVVRQTAEGAGVTVIDVYSATIDMPDNFPDSVHPNDDGTKVIANIVDNELSKHYISYGDMNKILRQGPVIPGLKQGIVPQGTAYVPDKNWMLISYYREGKPSGITVTDLTTGKLIKALELYQTSVVPFTGHAGGIAVSADHVWISSDSKVCPIPLQAVEEAADGDKLVLSKAVSVETNSSFVTYANGILWVGEFANRDYSVDASHHMTNRDGVENPAWVAGYALDAGDSVAAGHTYGSNVAIPDYILSIPEEIQGMTVIGDKVLLSSSYGRNNDSLLRTYTFSLSDAPQAQTSKFGAAPVPIWIMDGKSITNTLSMPPMAEGLFERSGSVYVLFESGAQAYADGKYPVDRMQLLDAQSLVADRDSGSPAAYHPPLIITEIMAAPKATGEPYEYVELYNTTDQPIDLTGYQIQYYTKPELQQPWVDPNAKKWPIEPMDSITGGATNMTIAAHDTKIVWLIKPQYAGYTVGQFIAEYDPGLQKDKFVYARLGANEGLDNAVQRFVAIVGPGGNVATDRISMAAYNVKAGTGGCKYVPDSTTPACDFAKSTSSDQSIIYFLPDDGLDAVSKLMERRTPDSLNQVPTPGKLSPGQGDAQNPGGGQDDGSNPTPAVPESLLITEIMAAPKGSTEQYEYVELFNATNQPIDLTGYKLSYYTKPALAKPWLDDNARKWSIVAMDAKTGGTTNMVIAPYEVKVVWLVKDNVEAQSLKAEQFIATYNSSLEKDQLVYAKLGPNEGLENAVQRFVAVEGPAGDRISMAAYNVKAGTGGCQYSPSTLPGCDFSRVTDKSDQSVIYYFPENGLDPESKLMEHKDPDSIHQTPTPGKLTSGQVPGFRATPGISSVTLEWGSLGLDVDGYQVYKNGEPAEAAITVAGTTYSAVVQSLLPKTAYTFSLRGVTDAVYGQGNSSVTDSVYHRDMFRVLVTTLSLPGADVRSSTSSSSKTVTNDNHPIPNANGVTVPMLSENDYHITRGTQSSGQSVAQIEVDGEKLLAAFGADSSYISLAYDGTEPVMEVLLPASALEDLKSPHPDGRLVIYKNDVSYDVPLAALKLQTAAQQLGTEVENTHVRITIAALPQQELDKVRSIAAENDATLLTGAYEFRIDLESAGQQLEWNDFGGQTVTRTLVIHGAVPTDSLTGVYIDADNGKLHYIPASVKEEADGNTYVTMTTTHNSIYSVIKSAKTYDDITGHWAELDVREYAAKQILNGMAQGKSFYPDQNISRAEFADLLVNAMGMAGQPLNKEQLAAFSDVDANKWYAKSVRIAAAKGLVEGYSSTEFNPNALITREEMAVMLIRALRQIGQADKLKETPLAFDDQEHISEWARTAVAELVGAGIIEGMTEDTFVPADHATRAQAVVMTKRMQLFMNEDASQSAGNGG